MKISSVIVQEYQFNRFSPPNKVNNIAFKGVKQNLRTGEAVLKDFRKEFNFQIKSNTHIFRKMLQHCCKPNGEMLWKKLSPINNRIFFEIQNMKTELKGFYLSVDNFVDQLKQKIKLTKHGNCNEQAEIIKQKFIKRGYKAYNVGIIITVNETKKIRDCGEHVFTVFGLKENADLTKPSTWGNKAVIVDPWVNIVMKAHDGLKYIKRYMFFNSETTTLHYGDVSFRKKKFMPFFQYKG